MPVHGAFAESAAGNDAVAGLVYVCAFAPEQRESAHALSVSQPGAVSETILDAVAA